MRRFDNRKLHIGFLMITLLVFVIGLSAYHKPFEKQQQGNAVIHTHEVLGQLENLSNHLVDAETGQRGYILTGEAPYLRPYFSALQPIKSDLARFQQLTIDNPRQKSLIPSLRKHIAAKLSELKETINLRKNGSLNAALTVVVSRRGIAEMDAIRQDINEMKLEEQRLLQQRMTVWVATERTRWMFLGTAILFYVLLAVVYWVLIKEAVHRQGMLTVERQSGADHRIESERLVKVVAIQRDLACPRQGLQATMQTITERTRKIVQADGGVVAMVEGDELVCRAWSGITSPVSGLRWKIADSLAGQCVRENDVLTCNDTEMDDRVDRGWSQRIGVRSVVVVPLCHNGAVIGVFTVVWCAVNAYTEQDVVTLELIAGALSSALSDAVGMDLLQASELRLDEAQQTAHLGSWELDLASRKFTVSKEFCRMIGMAPERRELDYAAYQALYAPEDTARLDEHIQRAVREGVGYEEDVQRTLFARETPHWYHAIGKPMFDAKGGVVRLAGTLMDITERKSIADALESHQVAMQEVNGRLVEAVIRLDELATTDGLTGLKNHQVFYERLKEEYDRAVRYHSPLSVVILDVDKFKDYNDNHGHQGGDAVLKQVGEILQREARNTDTVARYGGEEFVLILPETGAEEASKLAERLRQAIASASWEDGGVTASFGVATLSVLVPNAAELVGNADKAMYRSKDRRRNRVTHFDAMEVDSPDMHILDSVNALVRTDLVGGGEILLLASEQIKDMPYQSCDAMMSSWSRILDLKDKETEGHSGRVTEMMIRLTQHLGMTEEDTMFARWGAMVHDIGKLGVPDHILRKPGPLNDEEWVIMRHHTTLAYELLRPIEFLGPALDIPYCHHEKWDGSGYPCGLKGEDIPLMARLFAVVDVHDALTSDRPYRKAWSEHEVRTYLREQAGSQFDPVAVDAFLTIMEADRPVLNAA